ncbi:hypothetical protein BRADI_4g28716v3 [Brachypodium distachyon]|uniref:Uncharacterized protein n=1 Tax=Brachypodium distachyon TaxID=15368 RepID=A0A0Q3ERA9_BRADI|nr:hypothetical protein BRADI_4g28716v3 [Brachypodium distachyon]
MIVDNIGTLLMRRLKGSTAPTSLHYDHVVKASYKAQVGMSNILLPVHDTENVSHGYKFEASVWIQFKEIRHEKSTFHVARAWSCRGRSTRRQGAWPDTVVVKSFSLLLNPSPLFIYLC